ncbi:MAG: metallophosphoesterase [Janthinobacterium lividum]
MSQTPNMIVHFARNRAGRDFAVGDVHGCFPLLRQRLEETGFDPACDRLFSVGDLVDRGPDSEVVLDWISQPWFHAVRGNHEQMAIDSAAGRYDRDNYRANGGAWFLDLPSPQQIRIAAALDRLPIAIEVDTVCGTVGVVHADIAGRTWAAFRASLLETPSRNRLRTITETALWSRARAAYDDCTGVPDLHRLVVGHTPMPGGIRTQGNVVFIDTGAVFRGGHLTVIELDVL